eukprot:1596219-Rhodomonas_salina.1
MNARYRSVGTYDGSHSKFQGASYDTRYLFLPLLSPIILKFAVLTGSTEEFQNEYRPFRITYKRAPLRHSLLASCCTTRVETEVPLFRKSVGLYPGTRLLRYVIVTRASQTRVGILTQVPRVGTYWYLGPSQPESHLLHLPL